MKLALKQFRVLIWKCWIIRRRHYLTTLFELLFSLVANIIMVCVVNSINQKINPNKHLTNFTTPWINETIWPDPQYNLQDHLWKFVFAKPKILFSPNNNVTQTFIKELESVLCLRTCLKRTRVQYIGFDDETSLLNEYAKLNNNTDISKGLIGIIFQTPKFSSATLSSKNEHASFDNSPEMNHFLNYFAYKIRTTSFSINGFYPEKENAGPYKSNLYLEDEQTKKSFLETQIFVNEAYLSLLLKRANIPIMNTIEEEAFRKKTNDQQERIKIFLEQFDVYNETLDFSDDQFVFDSIRDRNKMIDSQLKMLRLSKQFKESLHPEFIKHAMQILITDHPLFVQNIRAKRMPYPKYVERPPTSLIDLVPYVITNSFIILAPVIVKRMSDEKVNRIRENFRLLGLKDLIYFLSTFANYFIGILPQVMIITLLYTTSFFGFSSPVFEYTSFFLVFLILLLYCVHLILMSMLVSIPVQRPVIGVVVSVVLFLISGLPHYFLDIRFNKGLDPNSLGIGQVISCFLPNMAINFIFRLISLKELYNYGANFSNLFEYTHMYGVMSIGLLMIVQMVSCIITGVLILYLDAIWSDEFGLSKHWLYPVRCVKKAIFAKRKDDENFDDFHENLKTKSIKRNKQEALRSKYFEDEETLDGDKVAILVRNLRKVYKVSANNEKVALDCINLKLLRGQLTALLGHNGAGKTTLMSIITGFINWNEGDVFINGHNLKTRTKLARKSISLCPQHNVLYTELNSVEHLYLYSVIKGQSLFRIEYDISVMLDKLQLTKKSHIVSENLSGGMKRKLNLAIALIGNSKIVILDEPTSGMDVESRRNVWNLLLEARRSKTILLSTHYMEEADAVSDKICIMSNGSIHCYGTPVFLKRTFGTGYQLRIAKKIDFNLKNREILDEFIKKYFNNSKKYSESQGEIIYLLNGSSEKNCSEMVQDGQFAKFFDEFESLKQNLAISSCGISVTTLEDVFLRVTTSDQFIFDEQYDNNPMKRNVLSTIDFGRKASNFNFENALIEDVTLTSYKERNGLDFSSMTDVELSSNNNSTMDFIDTNLDEIENCFWLGLQRFKALMIKRYHYLTQTYIMFIVQLLIPLTVFSIIIFVDQFLRSRLHFDQPFELEYDVMYRHEHPIAYFQHNNQTAFPSSYIQNSQVYKIEVEQIDLDQDLNRVILDKVQKIGISNYVQRLLISASEVVGNESTHYYDSQSNIVRKSFDVWFNNEVLHSLPISINLLYESIIRHLNLSKQMTYDANESPQLLRIHTTNHPFPNQLHYMYHFTSIQQFKIMWSLIISLTLPFLAAYYSVFPIQEHSTRSKLLQIMTGLSCKLWWFANFISDFVIHLIECGLIVSLFYCIDTVGVFIDFDQTMIGLFLLMLLYGICSILMAYIYSHLAPEVSTGYVLYVIFNLIFGLILSICDYIVFYTTEFGVLNKSTYEDLVSIFKIFPLYSMTQGIVHLYVAGSKAHVCDNLNSDILMMTCNAGTVKAKESVIFGCCKEICEDNCYEYRTPFNWSSDGILNELLMMSICAVIAFVVLVICESNINLRGCIRTLMNRGQVAKESKPKFFIEDLDVLLERNRIDQLVKTSANFQLINKTDSLVVQSLNKRYANGQHAVNKLSFGVKGQECFGFLGVNGAGKTTTFRILVGETSASSGDAFINGFGLQKDLKKFQQQIGYVPQFNALLPELSGHQLLLLFGRLRGIPESVLKDKISQIIRMTDLEAHSKRLSSSYSGGTKRKLSLAIALIGNPKIVFLDEPTAGVDPEARRKIWKTLAYLKKVQNCSILLTSHSMEECEALCSRLAIMVNGQFKCLGSIQQLRKKYGQGYSLTIKMNQRYANKNSEYIRKLKERLTATFTQCILKDVHQTVISYQILDSSLSWSYLFKMMDMIKQEFDLEYYLLGDTTLEQIFISFARQE